MASKLEYTYNRYYYREKRRSKGEIGLQSKMRIQDHDRQRATPSSVEYSRWRAITAGGEEPK